MFRNHPHISSFWRSEKHRKIARELGRFGLTVVMSSVLTIWIQRGWRGPDSNSRLSKSTSRSRTPSSANPQVPVGKTEDLYRRHLEEIVHTLKSQGGERMADTILPSVILKYQRNVATNRDGSSFQLDSQSDEAPFMAVSKKAKRFLNQMLVIYIEPADLPPGLLEGGLKHPLPFSTSVLQDIILVPDLTGNNAAFFTFEKR
jgi:hypothetical protein